MIGVISFSLNKTDEEVFESCRIAYNNFDDINEIEEIRTRKDPFEEGRSELLDKCLTEVGKYQGVNVIGYAVRCDQLSRFSKISREENIIDREDLNQGYQGATETSLFKLSTSQFEENDFDKVNDLIDYAKEKPLIIAEFELFYEEVAIERGINLRTLIKKSRHTEHCRYVKQIRTLVEAYGKEQLIKTVLSNQELYYELGLKEEEDVPLPVYEGYEQSYTDGRIDC